MQRIIPLKFTSWVLFVVLLTATAICICENAHAAKKHFASAGQQTLHQECASASEQCPACPLGQHDDYDDCGACANCSSLVSLTIQSFQFSYAPLFLDLGSSESFKYLPEVYLSKFIPPQNKA